MLLHSDCIILLQDMIVVVESKPTKQYGDYFLRQVAKVSVHIVSECAINSGTFKDVRGVKVSNVIWNFL